MNCAIYCRLSKEDGTGAESESIQNQKSLLLRCAAERGWEVYDLYVDEDYSGVGVRRPAFERLLRDAEARRFGVVLCKTQSRFTRDMEEVERYIHKLFPLWGVRFVAVADNADSAVKGNKKARQIAGLVNEWYSEDLSENVRAVLDHKRREGLSIASFPLYGYRKGPVKGSLEPDPEAAAVVRRIFAAALAGKTAYAIARELTAAGVPNPTGYKRRQGERFRPGAGEDCSERWSKITVARILQNEMYTGVMVQGRRRKLSYKSQKIVEVPQEEWFVVAGTHPALVSRADFERVRALTEERKRKRRKT
jgi:DNA invertase Pin-like site-specific DNA recombinase